MKKVVFILVAIMAFCSVNAQQNQFREITTSCNIIKPLIGLDNGHSEENLELLEMNFKIEIEWTKLGNGGICNLWLINKVTGEKILFKWSSFDNLKLIQFISTNERDVVYTLTNGVFIFFHIAILNDEVAFANIQTHKQSYCPIY